MSAVDALYLHISTQLLKQNYLEGISFTLEIQLFT